MLDPEHTCLRGPNNQSINQHSRPMPTQDLKTWNCSGCHLGNGRPRHDPSCHSTLLFYLKCYKLKMDEEILSISITKFGSRMLHYECYMYNINAHSRPMLSLFFFPLAWPFPTQSLYWLQPKSRCQEEDSKEKVGSFSLWSLWLHFWKASQM